MSDEKEIELTEKQKRFCESYFLDYNGSRAYKEVYGDVTDGTARANASDLLTKTNIKSYLESLKIKLAEISGISPLTVLNEYKKIAFSSIASLHNTWIERKEFETLSKEEKDCIQEIETKVRKEYEFNPSSGKKEPVSVEYVKIKLFDKLKGLENINRMLGYNAPDQFDLKSGGEKINQITDDELINRIDKIINSTKKE